MKYSLSLLLVLLISTGGKCQSLTAGTGFFPFGGFGPLREKPIKVHYHIPEGKLDSMPVLMAFHGDERDGRAYLNDWIAAANTHQFMVFAPEFSTAGFPGGDAYNLGNMYVDGDNPTPQTQRPDSLWTFSVIEPLFEEIKQKTNNISGTYVGFGHSAGSQFLSRFQLFLPENRMQLSICANAGWYTVPDPTVKFPYGTGQSPATEAGTRKAFAKNLLVLLGKLDTNPNSPGLRHNQQVDKQGLFRLARGRYFYAESQKLAQSQSAVFNWKIAEVEGVGHDHTLMANAALNAVLEAFKKPIPPDPKSVNPEISWSPDGIRISGLVESESYEITAFNLSGQPIWNTSGTFQGTKTMYWKPAVKGIYILQLQPKVSPARTIKILSNN